MQLESVTLELRPRTVWEGADLGVRLLHASWRSVYRCHLAVALPLFALCLSTVSLAEWLPALLIWLSKPWLDRSTLFCLSRALFGAATRVEDLVQARREVLGAQLLATLIAARLSASRSFTQPIVQLEGLQGAARRERQKILATRRRGAARMMTQIFALAELALFLSVLMVPAWLSPHHEAGWNPFALSGSAPLSTGLAYGAAVLFLEPFYVAAGFGMYLNRRVELEAWDIEQEFRRAFAA